MWFSDHVIIPKTFIIYIIYYNIYILITIKSPFKLVIFDKTHDIYYLFISNTHMDDFVSPVHLIFMSLDWTWGDFIDMTPSQ